ncbi:MAG: S-layer protein [Pseudomonas sp.]|nr:S-layer protein [Pseudomonas sp.]
MKINTAITTCLLLAALLCPPASFAQQAPATVDVRELASSPRWLTSKVYIEGAPQTDIKVKYPGVVGISTWDTKRNRYEFFYTDTGESKYNEGGGGYYFITGDYKTHVLVPDIGPTKTVVRRLEKLNQDEFTYSREVPRDMVAGNPLVRIYVVHTPYTGTVNTQSSMKTDPNITR